MGWCWRIRLLRSRTRDSNQLRVVGRDYEITCIIPYKNPRYFREGVGESWSRWAQRRDCVAAEGLPKYYILLLLLLLHIVLPTAVVWYLDHIF